jgi:transposase
VVGAIEGGTTIPEAAEQCGVSLSSVVRFLKLQRETGSVGSAKFGGYKDFALAAHEDLVRQLVPEQPDITLAELEDRLTRKKITIGKSSAYTVDSLCAAIASSLTRISRSECTAYLANSG